MYHRIVASLSPRSIGLRQSTVRLASRGLVCLQPKTRCTRARRSARTWYPYGSRRALLVWALNDASVLVCPGDNRVSVIEAPACASAGTASKAQPASDVRVHLFLPMMGRPVVTLTLQLLWRIWQCGALGRAASTARDTAGACRCRRLARSGTAFIWCASLSAKRTTIHGTPGRCSDASATRAGLAMTAACDNARSAMTVWKR